MAGRCRMSDTGNGVCTAHQTPTAYVTVFNTGAASVLTNDLMSVTVGSVGISSCGHSTVAIVGRPTVLNENQPSHTVGDTGANAGTYVAATGSHNVIDEG